MSVCLLIQSVLTKMRNCFLECLNFKTHLKCWMKCCFGCFFWSSYERIFRNVLLGLRYFTVWSCYSLFFAKSLVFCVFWLRLWERMCIFDDCSEIVWMTENVPSFCIPSANTYDVSNITTVIHIDKYACIIVVVYNLWEIDGVGKVCSCSQGKD